MGQDRVGETEGNERFAHADLVSKDLDFKAQCRSRVKKAIKQDVHCRLLACGVFGVLDAGAIASQVEISGAGDHESRLAPPASTVL